MGKHGALRVYVRGSYWWAHVPGKGRVSLGLPSERWQRLMRQAEARGIEVDDALSEALAAAALAIEQARLTMDDYPRGCPFLARRLPCPSWAGRSCLRNCDAPL